MNDNKKTVVKWYKNFGFPSEMDDLFYSALEKTDIPDGLTPETLPALSELGAASTVYTLYFLEGMEEEYNKRGIASRFENDIMRTYNKILNSFKSKGTLDLGDLRWDKHYLMAREFRIGRLVFTLGNSPTDVPRKGIKTGDRVVQIHVPGGTPLIYEDCRAALKDAKEFLEKHFPDFEYRYFTILSWLLDDSIGDILGEGSNVIKFASLFEKVATNPSDNILRFVFGNGTTRATIGDVTPKNRFQRELKDAALVGRVFYDVRGVIDSYSL